MRGKSIYLPGMEMEGQSAKEKVGLPKPSQLKVSRANKTPTLVDDFRRVIFKNQQRGITIGGDVSALRGGLTDTCSYDPSLVTTVSRWMSREKEPDAYISCVWRFGG